MYKRPTIFIFLLLITCSLFAQYDPDHFYFQGRQALIDGKYPQAIDRLNLLARIDSTRYEAYFFRGIAKYNLGDLTGAQMDFDRTLHFNPIYTPAYHYRAITLSRMGRYDQALKDLEEAVELRPNYAGLYFSRGITYFLSQQFDLAINDFNRFIRKMPQESDAYLNRGACYLFKGDTIAALRDYDTAIERNRFDPEGYVRRSRVYGLQGRYDDAIRDLDTAVGLDSTNTFAFFNRGLLHFEKQEYGAALADLGKVLEEEPGNALTRYNRALVRIRVADYEGALEDLDRVLNINPDNVLAYFNRAILFTEMGRWRDAMDDYSKAINLYPDFAQAYLNRSYVKNLMGQYTSSRQDFQIAQRKIAEYRSRQSDSTAAFADTSRQFNRLLALDADFARSGFENELLRTRDLDIRLKPLYRFVYSATTERTNNLTSKVEDPSLAAFSASLPINTRFAALPSGGAGAGMPQLQELEGAAGRNPDALNLFAKGVVESDMKLYNKAMLSYDEAIGCDPANPYLYINRAALQADMIDFLASMENSVQQLAMDESHTARTRVQDRVTATYDYTPALHDMARAASLADNSPHVHYNMGNLYCLSGDLPEAISRYTRAIELASELSEAYYNRGLVLIYLKDKEKGCIDLSVAGGLGIEEAYGVIKKYCKTEEP